MSEMDYLDLLSHIIDNGVERGDRTGTGTLGVFGPQLRFNLAEGFPLLTTKRVPLRIIAVELLWFIQGRTDKSWLTERNVHIWDEWDAPGHPGFIGPGYGWQWRSSGASYDSSYCAGWVRSKRGVDQLADVIEGLRSNPEGRRHIVDVWSPTELAYMALPPCHMTFQFWVANGKLSCQLYQRSADMFLGVPFNIASYALLTHIIAREIGLGVGEFIWTGGDAHVYRNHIEQVTEQINRVPQPFPQLHINESVWRLTDDILPRYEAADFTVRNYNPAPAIKAPVAV